MTNNELQEVAELYERVTPQWLAGFFDGEGCVHARIRRGWQHHIPPSVIVTLVQKDLRPLWVVQLKYPGTNGPRLYQGGGSAYILEWSGKNCIGFLNAIKDYVVVKRIQVMAGIELASLITDRGVRNSSVPSDVKKRRWQLAEIIKEANSSKHAYAIT